MKKLFLFVFISVSTICISHSQLVQQNPNFPSPFDSAFHHSSGDYGAPVIVDINKDGKKEIITVTSNESYSNFYLYILLDNGQPALGFPITFNSIKALTIGDVDGNGFLDIVIRSCMLNSNYVTVLDYKGIPLPGFPKDLIYSTNSTIWPVTLYDLDGNGKLEVICSEPNNIHVFNYDGTERTGWPRPIIGIAIYQPAVGDLDHDGMAEIIFPAYKLAPNNDTEAVHVFRQDGSYFPGWPIYLDSNYNCASPSVYIDPQNSSSNFIILPLTQGNTIRPKILKVSPAGTILNSIILDIGSRFSKVVMGDVNNDGQVEFATAPQVSYEPNLYVFSNNLSIFPGWPQFGSNYMISLTLGKVIPGNTLQVISGVQMWGADDYGGFIFIYERDGSQLDWSPFRPIGLTTGVTFSDFDNDGSADIIINTIQNKPYIHLYKIPGVQFNLQNFPWPMAYHDRYRTNQYGFIPPDEPIGIKPISENLPNVYKLYQNYPNPFNPVTKIEFDIRQHSFVKIIIYDVLGREVKSLISEYLAPGKYKMEWNASSYSSGVYFCKLIIDTNPENPGLNKSFSEIKKMVLVK